MLGKKQHCGKKDILLLYDKMNALKIWLGRAPTTSFMENALGTTLATPTPTLTGSSRSFLHSLHFCGNICYFFRSEETLTQNLRSLTRKYQDLEDSYSE